MSKKQTKEKLQKEKKNTEDDTLSLLLQFENNRIKTEIFNKKLAEVEIYPDTPFYNLKLEIEKDKILIEEMIKIQREDKETIEQLKKESSENKKTIKQLQKEINKLKKNTS